MSNPTITKMNPFPPTSDGTVNLPAVIEVFSIDIGLGYDIQDCEIRQGGNNNVVMFSYMPFTTSDPTQPPPSNSRRFCILRTRKKILINSLNMRCKAIKTIVAVMHSFGEGSAHPSHLPIPAILAYDETYDNAIKCPYIIQRRAAGDDLKEWYKVLDSQVPATGPYDLTDRLRIAEEIAKFLARTENGSQLQVYGTLINGLGMLAKDIEFSGEKMEVRIRGPSVGTVQIPSLLHHIDMIERLIEAWIKILSPGAGAAQAEYQNVVELKGIFQQMKQEGRLDRVSSAATLWHQDLYPRNIMFNRAGVARELKLTAVIDWDGAMVLPRIMTRRPPHWLWKYNELHENHRKIIKNHFYTYMERLVPGYREDAEGREARVVRALYVYAFWGPEYGYHTELSFKELLKEWEKMGVEEMF